MAGSTGVVATVMVILVLVGESGLEAWWRLWRRKESREAGIAVSMGMSFSGREEECECESGGGVRVEVESSGGGGGGRRVRVGCGRKVIKSDQRRRLWVVGCGLWRREWKKERRRLCPELGQNMK